MGPAVFRVDGETLTVRQMLFPVRAADPARVPVESEVSEGDKVVQALPPSAGGRDVRLTEYLLCILFSRGLKQPVGSLLTLFVSLFFMFCRANSNARACVCGGLCGCAV